MSQRLVAACVAAPLVLLLLLAAALAPLPYATYSPGLTVDVLAKDADEAEVVQVIGAETYRDDGELRMTTVSVSLPKRNLGLVELMGTWWDDEDAVYPYDAVYGEDETEEDNDRQGAVSMVTSQDAAIAVAETELGYQVSPALQVAFVEKGMPAEGKLEVRDIVESVNAKAVRTDTDLRAAINKTPAGEQVRLGILRDGKERTVSILPSRSEGRLVLGITPGIGYKFPVQVQINISSDIGGPSAGLMFSLAVYDTLTPGSLTDEEIIAGTGEIDAEGKVGAIGGIQQKIVGAREAGAELFLVPADNCEDALGAQNGDMQLVRAETMSSARKAIEAWAKDRDAELPSCGDAS